MKELAEDSKHARRTRRRPKQTTKLSEDVQCRGENETHFKLAEDNTQYKLVEDGQDAIQTTRMQPNESNRHKTNQTNRRQRRGADNYGRRQQAK